VHAVAAVLALLALNCSGSGSSSTTSTNPPAQNTNADDRRCTPPSGVSGNPKTINEMLELLNALPRPVHLPCLLESLDRPLALNATSSINSVQPALGKRSPRTFLILNDALSMSVVPGEPTLEFGEYDAEGLTSVKGELLFPIEDELTIQDAFERLRPEPETGLLAGQTTRCGKCHASETSHPDYPVELAFSSVVLKAPAFFAVDVAALKEEHLACEPASEPERCALLDALFDHGDVVQKNSR